MSNKNVIDLTQEGLEKLQAELDKLRTEERPRIIQAIKDARAQGDLSENADYDAARDEQAKVESRIQELEYMLENSRVVKPSKDVVGLGSTVVVEFDEDDTDEFKIVGSNEVSVEDNKISTDSPIGKALFGHKPGETVSVEAPNGSFEIKIVEIK